MSLKSADKKKLARKKDIDQMLIEEYAGYVNFVIGKVKKIGRQKVLEQTKTAFATTEFYWLKQEYDKIMDHVQDMRIKQIAQKIEGGSEENPIRIIYRAAPDPVKQAAG